MHENITGSCLCGHSKYRLSLPETSIPLTSWFCHCNRCRHISGVLCTTTVDLPHEYEPPQSVISKLKEYKSSRSYARYFCPICGTHVLERDNRFNEWKVLQGTLDSPEGLIEVKGHMFIEDTLDGGCSDWLLGIDGRKLERWPGFPNESHELPRDWHEDRVPVDLDESMSLSLPVHCDCKGVEFFIARPSERSKDASGPYPDALLPYYITENRPDHEEWWLRDGGRKYLASACTCDSCRLATGSEFQEWAFVPCKDMFLDADHTVPFNTDFGTLQSYKSSAIATRHFCSKCGATIFWNGKDRGNLMDVSVGLLASRSGARAQEWLEWRQERVSYREDAMKTRPSTTKSMEAGLLKWHQ